VPIICRVQLYLFRKKISKICLHPLSTFNFSLTTVSKISTLNIVHKFFLSLIVVFGALTLFTVAAKPAAACETNDPFQRPISGYCAAACSGTKPGVWEGYVEYSKSPSFLNSCIQLDYFSVSTCDDTDKRVANPCSAGCSSDSECGEGTCASGSVDYTTVCSTGNRGSGSFWCQGYNCGYKCTSSYTCERSYPGGGSYGPLADCQANCKASTNTPVPPTPTFTPVPPPPGVVCASTTSNPCGCSSGCHDGTNLDYSCCHRTCQGNSCATVPNGGTSNCNNNNDCITPTPTDPPAQTKTTCCICGSNGLRPAGSNSDCSSSNPQCRWNSSGPCWDSRDVWYSCGGYGSCTSEPDQPQAPTATPTPTPAVTCYTCDQCKYHSKLYPGNNCPLGACNPNGAPQDGCSSSSNLNNVTCDLGNKACIPDPTATPTPPMNPPGTPNVTVPACINPNYYGDEVAITWGSSWPLVSTVDFSDSSSFSTYFYKNVTLGTQRTLAPLGFSGSLGLMTLNPNTAYFIRLYNGAPQNGGHSPSTSFSIPACPTQPPLPTATPTPTSFPGPIPIVSCVDVSPYSISVSWIADNIIRVDLSDSFDLATNVLNTIIRSNTVTPGTHTTTFTSLNAGTPYAVRLFSGTYASRVTPFTYNSCGGPTPSPTTKPWVKTVGGDIHSNQ
jgi:hypothetical protein